MSVTVPVHVHVITRGTRARPTRPLSLFGIHRGEPDEASTCHVLAFQRLDHAMAMARGVEAYRRHHGAFPSRDSADIMQLGELDPHAGALEHVAVDVLDLVELADRLRGTGIVLSLLAATGVDDTFAWADMREEDDCSRLAKLQAAWHYRRGPNLLPKPTWPPAKSATALGYLIANHITRFWK